MNASNTLIDDVAHYRAGSTRYKDLNYGSFLVATALGTLGAADRRVAAEYISPGYADQLCGALASESKGDAERRALASAAIADPQKFLAIAAFATIVIVLDGLNLKSRIEKALMTPDDTDDDPYVPGARDRWALIEKILPFAAVLEGVLETVDGLSDKIANAIFDNLSKDETAKKAIEGAKAIAPFMTGA
jgi:hypothetical protein